MEVVLNGPPSPNTLKTAGSRVKRVVLLSLGLTVTLTLIKYLLYRYTGSLAVQADAYHSGSDVIAGLLVLLNCLPFWASRRWCRLGSGLVIAGLIALSAVKVGYEAYQGSQAEPVNLGIAISVTLGAIAVSYLIARYKIRIGHEENFPLLVMEGQHTMTDALSSGVVLVGILGHKTGIRLDAACALVIAILIVGIAVEVVRDILHEEGNWSGYRVPFPRLLLLATGFGVVYLLTGVYQVAEGEVGIIERFGKFVRRNDPGLHYHLPVPFEYAHLVQTEAVHRFDIGPRNTPEAETGNVSEPLSATSSQESPASELSSSESSANSQVPSPQASTNTSAIDPVSNFLHESPAAGSSEVVEKPSSSGTADELFRFTGDQTLLSASIVVSYHISAPISYLYRVDDVQTVLRAMCESVLTTAFAQTPIDDLLGANRAIVLQRMLMIVNEKMSAMQIGVKILHLAYLDLEPPEEVIPAFRMASSAKEDRERYINEAETYAHRIMTNGRAESEEILQEAHARASWLLANVQAEVAGIDKLFALTDSHSTAMKQNLYLETLEGVLRTNPQLFFSGLKTPVYLDFRQQKEQP